MLDFGLARRYLPHYPHYELGLPLTEPQAIKKVVLFRFCGALSVKNTT